MECNNNFCIWSEFRIFLKILFSVNCYLFNCSIFNKPSLD